MQPSRQCARRADDGVPGLGRHVAEERHALQPRRRRDPGAVELLHPCGQPGRLADQRGKREHHRRKYERSDDDGEEQRRDVRGRRRPEPLREAAVERPRHDRDDRRPRERLDEAPQDPERQERERQERERQGPEPRVTRGRGSLARHGTGCPHCADAASSGRAPEDTGLSPREPLRRKAEPTRFHWSRPGRRGQPSPRSSVRCATPCSARSATRSPA